MSEEREVEFTVQYLLIGMAEGVHSKDIKKALFLKLLFSEGQGHILK